MALPSAYFFLCLLFFLPNFYFSCPNSLTCGDVEIHSPFFLNTSDHPSSTDTTPDTCAGKYSIRCDDDSGSMIKFNDREYPVIDIIYPEKVLILQDLALGNYLLQGKCGFLYKFTDPIPNFHVPPRSPVLILPNISVDCQRDTHAFSRSFFPELNGSNHCNDYKLYYWEELEDHHAPASHNCLVTQPTLLEWKLSFGGDKGSWSRKKTIGMGSVVGAGLLLICLSVAFYFYRRRKASHSITFCKNNLNKNNNVIAFLEEYGSLAPRRYSYSSVKKITKGFKEKLGQGGFSTVFKGTLSNGHEVAVKILNDSKGDGEDFINEVTSIGRTSHVNVVSLLGFCFEGSKRALIYDFMCNGSLEKLLYFEKSNTTLDWEKLYQIVIGIARGLEYLHRGCNTRIVHFDIKPHNILLDQDFCPKISDFGLAKLCLKKDSIISIAGARGTIGYIAPEVFSRNFGVVSAKSDVYSFGMMVLEIAGGRKNENTGTDNSSGVYFPDWIFKHLDKSGSLSSFGVTDESEETVRKLFLVGLWCIQTIPQSRPPMSKVIEMLEGSVDDLQLPPKLYPSSSQCGLWTGNSSLKGICWDDCSSSANS